MKTLELKSAQFRRERESTWRELERLVARAEKRGLRRLSAEELRRLPQLYRATLSSLSVARAVSLDRNVLDYLESLASRAYLQVYANKRRFGQSISAFFTREFPRKFRGYHRYMALAAAVVILGGWIGFRETVRDPDRFYSFVSAELAGDRGPESTREELESVLYDEDSSVIGSLASFATFLFAHNSRVAILCFALGLVPGIFVTYLLFTTGLMLGAFAAIHHRVGLSIDLWGWLLPHGITEIFAIVLAGGAGFAIGASLVFPGRSTRVSSLAKRGRDVSTFAAAALVMLFLAALLEGFFRQLVQSVTVRYLVASATALFWLVYLGFVGRRRRETRSPA